MSRSRLLPLSLFAVFPLLIAFAQDPSEGPRLRLVVSGQLEGRLEPCGCASGQLGGLARRMFHLQQQRDAYELRIEGGNLIPSGPGAANELDEQKLETALMILDTANYDAVCLGPDDLRLPADVLVRAFGGFSGPVLSADLTPIAPIEDWPVEPFVDRTAKATKVRIAALTMRVPEVAAKTFRIVPPADAWRAAMTGVDTNAMRILVVHGNDADVRALSGLEPRPDLFVAVGPHHGEPPQQSDATKDGVPIVHPGTRGRILIDMTLARTAAGPRVTRYAPVPLRDSETAPGAMDDKTANEQILAHREIVHALELREALAERFDPPQGRSFVGSAKCKTCHPAAFDVWAKSKHGTAFTTLQKAEKGELKTPGGKARYGWPVTHYPDCVSCHVVGYGTKTGFVSPEKTPDLMHVGCESCHGPGSAHMTMPTKATIDRGNAATCVTCHDFEQSPGFDYAARWKVIHHTK